MNAWLEKARAELEADWQNKKDELIRAGYTPFIAAIRATEYVRDQDMIRASRRQVSR